MVVGKPKKTLIHATVNEKVRKTHYGNIYYGSASKLFWGWRKILNVYVRHYHFPPDQIKLNLRGHKC